MLYWAPRSVSITVMCPSAPVPGRAPGGIRTVSSAAWHPGSATITCSRSEALDQYTGAPEVSPAPALMIFTYRSLLSDTRKLKRAAEFGSVGAPDTSRFHTE